MNNSVRSSLALVLGLIFSLSQITAAIFGLDWRILFMESSLVGAIEFLLFFLSAVFSLLPFLLYICSGSFSKKVGILSILGNMYVIFFLVSTLYINQIAEREGLLYGIEFLVLAIVPLTNMFCTIILQKLPRLSKGIEL